MINNSKSSIIRLIALLIILSIAFTSLASCKWYEYVADSKEEILGNIDKSVSKGGKNYEFVTQYFRDWGMPLFDTTKMYTFELYFSSNYNFGDGMPDVLTHAKDTATLFLSTYYDIINKDDQAAITDALLTCYAYTLDDPYSVYRPAQQTEDFLQDLSGQFGGIGVLVEYNYDNGTILITQVYTDSPAEKAGIKKGDYIYAVEGKTVEELGINNVVNNIRGKIGTPVELTLLRDGEEITLTAIREKVVESSVTYEIDSENNIGYIALTAFKSNTYSQFKRAVDALEAEGVDGIIFDLRGNPGGYVYSVVDIVSYLAPMGQVIVSYQYLGSGKVSLATKKDTDGQDHVLQVPFVIICDGNTASSGEIFTSAMRDYRNDGILNGKIIGTTTYGKGVMQDTFKYLLDGSSVTMTVSYYNPPCGVNYHGIGIIPDIIVEASEEGDVQLDVAIETLKELINVK